MLEDAIAPEVPPPTSVRELSRVRLVVTAERLFARNGLDVSLRQIATAAGHRNPAAIQYHFGSKEGLIGAIIRFRVPPLNARRLDLLDAMRREGRADDLRGLVEAMAKPLLELDHDVHYVGFLARMNADPPLLGRAYASAGEGSVSGRALEAGFDRALGELPPELRSNRLRLANDLMLNGIANRRAREADGRPDELDEERFAQDLIDAMVGAFAAGTTAARRHVASTNAVGT